MDQDGRRVRPRPVRQQVAVSQTGLVEFRRRYNELLAQVVERIPDDRLQSPCRIGGGETVTLGFVIDDYVRHLKHHLGQIVQGATKSA